MPFSGWHTLSMPPRCTVATCSCNQQLFPAMLGSLRSDTLLRPLSGCQRHSVHIHTSQLRQRMAILMLSIG